MARQGEQESRTPTQRSQFSRLDAASPHAALHSQRGVTGCRQRRRRCACWREGGREGGDGGRVRNAPCAVRPAQASVCGKTERVCAGGCRARRLSA